jgi:hypothetical protein
LKKRRGGDKMMRHGYHMGMGFYGSYILIFILIVFSILIFLLLKNKSSPNPFIIRLIDVLKVNTLQALLLLMSI